MIADLAMQRALDQYHRTGIAGLTDQEKTLATLWYVESKVENGGFEHLYQSSEGELAMYAPSAFRAVGAEPLAQIAEQANAVFGAAGVPANRERRVQMLAAMPEQVHRSFDELEVRYAKAAPDLDESIERYLERSSHRDR